MTNHLFRVNRIHDTFQTVYHITKITLLRFIIFDILSRAGVNTLELSKKIEKKKNKNFFLIFINLS
jgi:hypothetical protein